MMDDVSMPEQNGAGSAPYGARLASVLAAPAVPAARRGLPEAIGGDPAAGEAFGALLAQRRSIRRLHGARLAPDVIERLQAAILRTPSAYGVPPWHVVIVNERGEEFWREVELAFRAGLDGERLDRYLDRLAGFRAGSAVALIYEDRTALPALREAWHLSEAVAAAFVQQGLGMVQLALWLALTAEGLVTSLQHWDWLVQERLAPFVGLASDRYQLTVAMPIGHPAEPPRPAAVVAPGQVISIDPRPAAALLPK